jgi:hypothetical protein
VGASICFRCRLHHATSLRRSPGLILPAAGASICLPRLPPPRQFAALPTHVMLKSICCKHMFQVFQIFQRYIAIVSYEYCKSRSGYYTCCISYKLMLQVSIQNILSTSDLCCKYFYLDVHMLQWLYTYVASVYFKCLSILDICCGKCFTFQAYPWIPACEHDTEQAWKTGADGPRIRVGSAVGADGPHVYACGKQSGVGGPGCARETELLCTCSKRRRPDYLNVRALVSGHIISFSYMVFNSSSFRVC